MTEPPGPELRWDVLEREWRVISAHRQARPNLPTADCPFCPGGLEAPEPYRVRVFPNRWPPLVPGPRAGLDPDRWPEVARGAAEVVLYSPDHHATLGGLDPDHLGDVVAAWRGRTSELGSRPEVAYVLCFENRGAEVGATISHPHGQVHGFPLVPPRVERILEATSCRVCADSEAASLTLAGDELAHCWFPSASAWPYGFRLAPRRHRGSLADLRADEESSWRAMLSAGLQALDRLWDRPMPYMLALHQTPCDGRDWPLAHLWLEVVCPMRSPGVARFVAAAEALGGVYQNPVGPEAAAAELRAAWP